MSPLVQSITLILSVLTIVADIIIFFAIISLLFAWAHDRLTLHFYRKISRNALLITFLVSLAAPLGSLFYSEVAGFAPCELCWWQRIFAYPLVIITAVGLWYTRKRKSTTQHEEEIIRAEQKSVTNALMTSVLILAIIGGAIALYHSYGQLLNPDVLPSCAATGVSCAKLYFVEFGYVAIPTMSLTSFLLIIMTAIIYKIGKSSA